MTVAQFFPPATGGHVSRSVSMMRTSLKFLAGKNRKLRVCLFRHLHPGLLDSLYARFLGLRLSPAWEEEVAAMRQWMTRTE